MTTPTNALPNEAAAEAAVARMQNHTLPIKERIQAANDLLEYDKQQAAAPPDALTRLKGLISRLKTLREEIEREDIALKAKCQEEETVEGMLMESMLTEGIEVLRDQNGVTATLAEGRLWARPADKSEEGRAAVAAVLAEVGWAHLIKTDFTIPGLSSAIAAAAKNGEEVPPKLTKLLNIQRDKSIKLRG